MIARLCHRDELPPEGQAKSFRRGDTDVCVATVDGRSFAVSNRCPHQGAPLAAGYVEDGHIVCPYHAWRFRLSDGAPESPGDPSLQTFELRIYENDALVRVPDNR